MYYMCQSLMDCAFDLESKRDSECQAHGLRLLHFQGFMFIIDLDMSFECVYCRYFLGTLNCMNVYIVDTFSGTLNFMNSTHFSRTCIFRDFFVGFLVFQ